jgi:hypothetical protein
VWPVARWKSVKTVRLSVHRAAAVTMVTHRFAAANVRNSVLGA